VRIIEKSICERRGGLLMMRREWLVPAVRGIGMRDTMLSMGRRIRHFVTKSSNAILMDVIRWRKSVRGPRRERHRFLAERIYPQYGPINTRVRVSVLVSFGGVRGIDIDGANFMIYSPKYAGLVQP